MTAEALPAAEAPITSEAFSAEARPPAEALLTAQLMVIAKAPVPGRAKTRLTPPCTPHEAAGLAAAALADTLDAVRATDVTRRVVAYDGDPALADLAGFLVLPQRGELLGARLANAFADAAGGTVATLLIGMDTPQVTAALLSEAIVLLLRDGAVYGPATDGGWWALGLCDPQVAQVLRDVPMSRPDTGVMTLVALAGRGIRPTVLPELLDVDTITDARMVATAAPQTRFAHALAGISGMARV